MFSDDNQSVSFLKEGGDEEFDKAMKGLQEFSCQVIEKNENRPSIDYEAHNVIKNLDNYYDNKMNFENNEMITPSSEVMGKLDNLYGTIMESKKDKGLEEERNREYLGDPKEAPSRQNTVKTNNSKPNSKRQSLQTELFTKNNKKPSKDDKSYLDFQRLKTKEEEDFSKSFYDYPVMSTPSIKGSFAAGFEPAKTNALPNQTQAYPNLVPGVPVYQVNNKLTYTPPSYPPNQHIYPGNTPQNYCNPAYGKPQPAYGQPMPAYGQPQPAYGQPQQNYGQPQTAYGQPQQNYGQPQQTYGQPQQIYGQPQPAANLFFNNGTNYNFPYNPNDQRKY